MLVIKKIITLLFCLFVASGLFAAGDKFYVDLDASGANNGSSWPNAFNKIEDALSVASDGDTIWVAEGTYAPTGAATNFSIESGVALYGGFDGTEDFLVERDIQGNVTEVRNGTSSSTFTSFGGFSEPISINGFTVNATTSDKTAFSLYDNDIEIKNCIVKKFSKFLDGSTSSAPNKVLIENCLVYDIEGANAVIELGGMDPSSELIIINNTFADYLGSGIEYFRVNSGNNANFIVKNNIFYNLGTANNINPVTSNFVFEHNLWSDMGGTCPNGCSGTGNIEGIDPEFKNPALNDYSLVLGSTAINTGGDLFGVTSVPDKDLAGNTRVQDGIIDIGAFEFGCSDPLVVTKTTDDGSCGTLRNAVNTALAGQEITFNISGPIVLDSTIRITTENLRINGSTGNVVITKNTSFTDNSSLLSLGINPFNTGGYNALFEIQAEEISFDSLTIEDGNFVTGEKTVAIHYYNNTSVGGDVFNVNFKGFDYALFYFNSNDHDITQSNFENNQSSIFIRAGQARFLIQENDFHGGTPQIAGGVYVLDASQNILTGGDTSNVIIDNNYFYDLSGNNSYGIFVDRVRYMAVTNNVIGQDRAQVDRNVDIGFSITNLYESFIGRNLIYNTSMRFIDDFQDVAIIENKLIGGANEGMYYRIIGGVTEFDLYRNTIENITGNPAIENASANYVPVIEKSDTTTVEGTITNATGVGVYRVEVFATDIDDAEMYIGTTSVNVTDISVTNWELPGLKLDTVPYSYLTATVTYQKSTSPLSSPFLIQLCNSLLVTKNSDNISSTCGELRYALENVASGEEITFAPNMIGETIILTSDLPSVSTSQIRINADINNDRIPDVILDGISANDGFYVTSDSVSIRGFRLINFNDNPIELFNAERDTIEYNYIGTRDGVNASPNAEHAILINGGQHHVIEGNLISGNSKDGIHIKSSSNNSIFKNLIGVVATGSTSLSNKWNGIYVDGISTNNQIGGKIDSTNVISGNELDGIRIMSGPTDNKIIRNFIGVDIGGTVAIPNLLNGIQLNSADRNLISENIVSGNSQIGIQLVSSDQCVIEKNLVGTDKNEVLDLGNGLYGIEVRATANENTIGGDAGFGNIISGNDSYGIKLSSGRSRVFNNIIGSNTGQTVAIPNAKSGILIDGSSDANNIGQASKPNIIAFNEESGVVINGSSNNKIESNYIGTNPSFDDLGNLSNGVVIKDASAGNEVNNNIIAFNGSLTADYGIAIESTDPKWNYWIENRIFLNGDNSKGIGIEPGAQEGHLPLTIDSYDPFTYTIKFTLPEDAFEVEFFLDSAGNQGNLFIERLSSLPVGANTFTFSGASQTLIDDAFNNNNFDQISAIWSDQTARNATEFSDVFKISIDPCTLNNGLVADYIFNGSPADNSGNGNNGTVSTALNKVEGYDGLNEGAYEFKSASEYITVPHASELSVANQKSFSVWVKPSLGYTADGVVFEKASNNRFEYVLRIESNLIPVFEIKTPDENSSHLSLLSTVPIPEDEWSHIVVNYDYSGANSAVMIINNGTPMSNGLSGTNLWTPNDADLQIGLGYKGAPFNGAIDDFKIYNKILSNEEIAILSQSIVEDSILVTLGSLEVIDAQTITDADYSWSGKGSGSSEDLTVDPISNADTGTYIVNVSDPINSCYSFSDEAVLYFEKIEAPSQVCAHPSSGQVELSWEDVSAPSGYNVIWTDIAADTNNISGFSQQTETGTSTTIIGLNNNTTYYFAIISVGGDTSSWAGATPALESGRAANFAGQSHIEIPYNSSLFIKDEFTIESWVYLGESNEGDTKLFCNQQWQTPKAGICISRYFFSPSDDRINITIEGENSATPLNFSIDSTYYGWRHLAVTFNASGQLSLFIDGELKTQRAGSVNGSVVSDTRNPETSYYISRAGWVTGNYEYERQMDEVRFWNIERSPSDINNSKDIPLLGKESGLMGLWHLDESSGSAIAYDASCNNNHGIWSGTPVIVNSRAMHPYSDTLIAEGSSDGTSVEINWNSNTALDVSSFKIYESQTQVIDTAVATLIATVPGTSHIQTGYLNCDTLWYAVYAVDNSGQIGEVFHVDSAVVCPPCDIDTTLTIDGMIEMCSYDTLRLSVPNDPNMTYKWFDSQSNVLMGKTDSILEITTPGLYWVEITSSVCVDSSKEINVTVKNAPDITPIVDLEGCDSVQLASVSGNNISNSAAYYTNSNGLGTEYSDGDYIKSSMTLYAYDETGGTPNCFDQDTLTVTIYPKPSITVTDNNPTTCGGNEGYIDLSGLTPNQNYNLSYDDGTSVGPNAIQADASGVIRILNLEAGNYSSIQLDSSGCVTIVAGTYDLSDPNAPTLSLSGSNITSCGANDGEILISGFSSGYIVSIQYDLDGVTSSSSSFTANASGEVAISPLDAGVYDAFSFGNGNCTFSDPSSIDLTEPCNLALVDFEANKTIVCLGDVITFENKTTGATSTATYNWDLGTNVTLVNGSVLTSDTTITVEFTQSGIYSIALDVTDGNTETTTKNNYIEVVADPSNEVIQTSGNLCIDDKVNLSVQSISGATYQWYVNTTYKIIGGNGNSIDIVNEGEYHVFIDGANCSGATDKVTVDYSSTAPVIVSSNNLLEFTVTGPLSGNVNYQWYIELNGEKKAIVGATNATYSPKYNGVYYLSIENGTCRLMSKQGERVNENNYLDAAKAGLNINGTSVTIPESDFISVYPNPVEDEFKLTYYSTTASGMELSIYDLLGNKKWNEEFKKNQAYFEYQFKDLELSSGVYLIVVSQNNQRTTFKMYIQ